MGESRRTCLETGSWSQERQECQREAYIAVGISTFHDVYSHKNLSVHVVENAEQLLLMYHISHFVSANSSLLLSPSNAVIICSPLTSPDNGLVEIKLANGEIDIGTTANYSCAEGYVLFGTKIRVCLGSGEWSGSEPQCRGK